MKVLLLASLALLCLMAVQARPDAAASAAAAAAAAGNGAASASGAGAGTDGGSTDGGSTDDSSNEGKGTQDLASDIKEQASDTKVPASRSPVELKEAFKAAVDIRAKIL